MVMLKANEGTLDRALRVAVGLVLIVLVALEKIGLWGLIGLVPLLTGLLGFCPVYAMLGIRTCPAGRKL
jgi:hypothetical protein